MSSSQQRATDRPAYQRRQACDTKCHTEARSCFGNVRRICRDRGWKQGLEGGRDKSIENGPGVIRRYTVNCKPTPQHNNVGNEADDEDVENSDEAISNVAWQHTCGYTDSVENDDKIEGRGIGHGEFVARKGSNLVHMS
jgi:hypothetical protein